MATQIWSDHKIRYQITKITSKINVLFQEVLEIFFRNPLHSLHSTSFLRGNLLNCKKSRFVCMSLLFLCKLFRSTVYDFRAFSVKRLFALKVSQIFSFFIQTSVLNLGLFSFCSWKSPAKFPLWLSVLFTLSCLGPLATHCLVGNLKIHVLVVRLLQQERVEQKHQRLDFTSYLLLMSTLGAPTMGIFRGAPFARASFETQTAIKVKDLCSLVLFFRHENDFYKAEHWKSK